MPPRRVKAARREIHLTLKQANYDYERIQYNTVVSAGMKMLNALEAVPADAAGARALLREGLSILLRVLYPVVPHIGCALWDELGFAATLGALLDAPWPQVDPAALAQDEIELVLQVNGKLRGKLRVPATPTRRAIEAAARASAEVAKHAAGAPMKKVDHRAGTARQCRRLSAAGAWCATRRRRALAGALAACGFHLRGDVDVPVLDALHQCAAQHAARHRPEARAFGRQHDAHRDAAGRAGDSRPLQHHRRQAGAVAVGRRARREYLLTKRLTFALHDAMGKDWLPAARNRRSPLVHVQRVRSARARGAKKRSS